MPIDLDAVVERIWEAAYKSIDAWTWPAGIDDLTDVGGWGEDFKQRVKPILEEVLNAHT